MSCTTPASSVAFSTTSDALDLVVAGDSFTASTADGKVLMDDALVTTASAEALRGPRWFVWDVLELTGIAAFGISDGSEGPIIREGAVNYYYLSDGRIVLNGVVERTVASLFAGDTVALYVDPIAGVAQFIRNGVPV